MNASHPKSYYALLGIAPGASEEDIRTAYRRQAKRFHPDTNPDDPGAEERFKQVAEAYRILSDPKSRQLYDHAAGRSTKRKAEPPPASPTSDVRIRLHLSLEEAARGGTRTLHYPRAVVCLECRGACFNDEGGPCPACEGNGWARKQAEAQVSWPAGVRAGYSVVIAGAGHRRGRNADPGSLHVEIIYKPHRYFTLVGADLHYRILIGLDLFIEGGTLRIPTLKSPIEFALQPRVTDGRVLKFPGKGLPAFDGQAAGDLIAAVELCLPKKLSQKERNKIMELMELPGFKPPVDGTGYVPRGD